MALNAATTPLVISLTQGGADAFVQGSVLTGLSGRQAYNCRQVAFEFTLATAYQVAGDVQLEIAITRRSKTAIPTWADSDVILKHALALPFVTSGMALFPLTFVHVFPLEMPIVEETIYAQLDSANSSMTWTAVARLEVELDTMSDIDRLNLITRSLT